jgi:micrococcal nuclease
MASLRRRGVPGAIALIVLLTYLLLAGGRDEHGGDAPGVEPGDEVSAPVERVVDGDTIEVSIGGEFEDVRYIGIDTPETVKPGEPVQCFGPQASDANHELVDGRTVRLVFDRELRDAYGRLLAYVYVGDTFVNEKLLAGGYARTLRFPPNTANASRFSAVERRASAADEGLWGAC